MRGADDHLAPEEQMGNLIVCVAVGLMTLATVPASKPTSTRPTETDDLRRIINELRSQVQKLKAENSVLVKELSEARRLAKATSQPTPSTLEVGATAGAAKLFMDHSGMVYDCKLSEDTKIGEKTIHRERWESRNWSPGSPGTIWIENGVVVKIDRS